MCDVCSLSANSIYVATYKIEQESEYVYYSHYYAINNLQSIHVLN